MGGRAGDREILLCEGVTGVLGGRGKSSKGLRRLEVEGDGVLKGVEAVAVFCDRGERTEGAADRATCGIDGRPRASENCDEKEGAVAEEFGVVGLLMCTTLARSMVVELKELKDWNDGATDLRECRSVEDDCDEECGAGPARSIEGGPEGGARESRDDGAEEEET